MDFCGSNKDLVAAAWEVDDDDDDGITWNMVFDAPPLTDDAEAEEPRSYG